MKISRITDFSDRVYDAVQRLLPQLAPDAVLPSEQYIKTLLASENIYFFIAEPDDDQIGGMLTIVTYKIPTGLKVWIEDVVVDASQRGKGVGKELIKFAVDYAKSLGADSVALTSRPSRVEANELYRKMGFVQYETNVYKFRLKS
jgi:ribosomal protein S18 acetylase RimI-like enzyme